MKSSRRIDTDIVRRDSRDRDVSHMPGGTRFGRKRPSMLSEFRGSKHYSHNAREGDRDSLQHYRPHSRYPHDTSGGGVSLLDHSVPSSGFHSKSKPDSSRSRHSRHHTQHHSTASSHHHYSNSCHHTNFSDATLEEETPVKRPRLMVDISRKHTSSADSVFNSSGGQCVESPTVNSPWTSGGLLTYHLEDIDSDDDDSLLQDEYDKKLSKSPTPIPTSPVPMPTRPPTENTQLLTPRKGGTVGSSPMPSKEELLMMMEKVDRDIAAAETQISALEKKQAELEETARTAASTPHSSAFSSAPSPTTPSTDSAPMTAEDTPLPSPSPSNRPSPKKSQMDIIYSDNRMKSRSAQSTLSSVSFSLLPSLTALYHQPSEAPLYYHNILSHQTFRPKLVQHIRRIKIDKHKRELSLCEEYDLQMARWEKSTERIESNPKKRLRDQKNRDLFERCFPELKAKREHQEKMTRVDQRGYGIVRSDAELKEIMYELCEQEEAPVRHRRTHAVIPPMLIEEREKRMRFYNSNGLISDPMALHRDSRFDSVWSEDEKSIFRDKFMFYPKNFKVISSFLPHKNPADCVLYYYLSKKREKFKHLIRKANLKRKKPFMKPSDFSNPHLTSSSIPLLPISLFASVKPKVEDVLSADEEESGLPSELGDWSEEEISSLKEGLRKYGRAWGKIYREVGGLKTATQCKQFYDKHCANKQLDLLAALVEHSSMKSAEKMRRKAESRKPVSAVLAEAKRKAHKPPNKPSLLQGSEEVDSENTASAYDSESNSDESSSESTITDSSPEDGSSNSAFVPASQQPKATRGKKPKPLSTTGFRRTSEEALDLFISAAEALNNIVPPEVAMHDHNYALPPSSLVNNMELQGLSLIAAAAAVVSPTLSKSAASTKLPSLSPVRAPRGRPPNSQRKGTNSTTCKLAPTLLSPAGTSPSVLLTEMKAAPLRARTRSAPSDRPKVSTLHVPRTGSTLARMSINSSSRTVSRGTGVVPPASYSRHKGDSTGGKNSTSSLKSMIAFQPSSPSTASSNNTSNTTANSTSAFEALVNVAVAAPPAELPCNSVSGSSTSCGSSASNFKSSSIGTMAFTATPLSRSQSSKDTLTIGVAGSNSNASNSGGTTTAYIDVNQAINILASLAQQQVSSSAANGNSQAISVLPNSRLFTQNSVSLLGNIVSQGAKPGSGGLMPANLSSSKGTKGLSMSATVDTLLGHLTSGMSSQSAAAKSTASKAAGGSGKAKKNLVSTKPDGSKSISNAVSGSGGKTAAAGSKFANSTLKSGTISQSIHVMGSADELSNLNLLSSLVAAVAASQSAPTPNSSLQSVSSSEPAQMSGLKTSIGQPSNLHCSSKTEMRRPLESIVSALATVNRNSSSSPLLESASNSSSYISSQGHTPTPSDDGTSIASSDGKQERDREVDKLIAASSSIKRTPSSVGSVYGVSSSTASAAASNELPRSVVRTGLGTMSNAESVGNNATSSENDLTVSLASIIPSYNPSMSSQSSLLLYTRSLSFPLSVSSEPSAEEEDHLESATRGISELSKLLGTDNSTDSNSTTNAHHDRTSVYKGLSNWNPADLLSNSSSNTNTEFTSSLSDKSGKPYLSSLLESQIHGTVHHTSLTAPKLANTNSGRSESIETTLDLDHSR